MIKPLLMAAILATPLCTQAFGAPWHAKQNGDVITNVTINFDQTQEVENYLAAEQTTEEKEQEDPKKKSISKKVIVAGCALAAGAVRVSWEAIKIYISVNWGAPV